MKMDGGDPKGEQKDEKDVASPSSGMCRGTGTDVFRLMCTFRIVEARDWATAERMKCIGVEMDLNGTEDSENGVALTEGTGVVLGEVTGVTEGDGLPERGGLFMNMSSSSSSS